MPFDLGSKENMGSLAAKIIYKKSENPTYMHNVGCFLEHLSMPFNQHNESLSLPINLLISSEERRINLCEESICIHSFF